MENEYTNKFYKQINAVYNPELNYSAETRAEIIESIINEIYQDGFIDGSNNQE